MGKIKLLELNKQQILELAPAEIKFFLLTEEIVHICNIADAYWEYNYEALSDGKPGLHAQTKNGGHTGKFFYSEMLFSRQNLLEIFANQIAWSFNQAGTFRPDYVAGIPSGATKLGKAVAVKLETGNIELIKDSDGRIIFPNNLGKNTKVLLVDDFFTKGTAAAETINVSGDAYILPVVMYILSRGWRGIISTAKGEFSVRPLGRHRVAMWSPKECPLCAKGSGLIKPKTPENWQLLNNSQL